MIIFKCEDFYYFIIVISLICSSSLSLLSVLVAVDIPFIRPMLIFDSSDLTHVLISRPLDLTVLACSYHWLRSQVASGAWAFSSHLNSFSCAFASGAAVMCVTNPIWLTKTRSLIQVVWQELHCFKKIWIKGTQYLSRGFCIFNLI